MNDDVALFVQFEVGVTIMMITSPARHSISYDTTTMNYDTTNNSGSNIVLQFIPFSACMLPSTIHLPISLLFSMRWRQGVIANEVSKS
jgi:hypothetical protein